MQRFRPSYSMRGKRADTSAFRLRGRPPHADAGAGAEPTIHRKNRLFSGNMADLPDPARVCR
jgi:hypothetical protein